MPGAYDGLRILDFTQGVAGAFAAMLLADFQAEVIKIEPPGGGRLKDEPGMLCWDRNKLKVTLDIETYEGLAAARELLSSADAALFDHAPGELERLGLDAGTVAPAHPQLIYVWMPPYGTEGRWSQLPPDHDLLEAVTGAAHAQFSHDPEQPIHLTTPQIWYNHGLTAANAVSAAIYERAASGLGQAVTVSGLHGTSAAMSGSAIYTESVIRLGGASPRGGAPHYRLYECSDGQWLFLATLFAQFFLKAIEAMDLYDLLADESIAGEFTNLMKPPGNLVAAAGLEARFKEKTRPEWLAILKAAGVPSGPVGDRHEWFASAPVTANGLRVELEHPKLGTVAMPGISALLSETPGSVRELARSIKLGDVPARAPTSTEPNSGSPAAAGGPLAGVRVLDLGVVIAGTYCGSILANLGADVIKVEPPEGDSFRPYGLGFVGYNQGKRSVCLDLKQPAGREAFLDLVRQADVVIDNYRLGVRERLGIAYPALAEVNPRIISCSVTGFGKEGPLATDPGFDPLLQALSGLMAAQGGPGGEPVFYQIPVNDVSTAGMVVFGVVAALNARRRTGRGQEVLTSLVGQSVLFQSGELTTYAGRPEPEIGGRDCIGTSATHRFYRCADEWISVACSKPDQFHALCVALQHPEWAGRYIAEKALVEPRDGALATLIGETLAAMPSAEAVDRLLTAGVPAAPALQVAAMFTDPWLWANGYFEEFEHLDYGRVVAVRGFADWGRSKGGYRRRAPGLGEHSTEVLEEFGFDGDRVAALIGDGVLRQG